MSAGFWKIAHLLKFIILCISCTSFVTELAPGGCGLYCSSGAVRDCCRWGPDSFQQLLPLCTQITRQPLHCFVCTFLVLKYKEPPPSCVCLSFFNVSFPPVFSLKYLPPLLFFPVHVSFWLIYAHRAVLLSLDLFFPPFFLSGCYFYPFLLSHPISAHHPVSITRPINTVDAKEKA